MAGTQLPTIIAITDVVLLTIHCSNNEKKRMKKKDKEEKNARIKTTSNEK